MANFSLTGDPNGPGLPEFSAWTTSVQDLKSKGVSNGAKLMNLTNDGFPVTREPAVSRCRSWLENNFAGLSYIP